ncbi:MAG: Zn-ribbon domain-containing OB-fold protein [Thermoplasmata archaeon]
MTEGIRAVRVWGRLADRQGHRLTAPDEDEFTLAIEALERLGTRPAPTLHGVGRLPEVFRWGLPDALGRSVAFCEHSPGAEGWRAALKEAAEAGSGPSIIFGVDGPAHLLDPPGPRPNFGAAAIALDLEGGSGPLIPLADRLPGGEATIESAQSIVDALRRLPGDRWGLDLSGWDPPPTHRGTTEAEGSRHRETRARRVVSEGAYVPEPRYREGSASRWRLAADQCPGCRTVTFPIRGWCRGCGTADGLERIELPRSGGRVEAVTTIHPGGQPTEFDPLVEASGGYDVVLVELAPGVRATLPVTDSPPGTAQVGDRIGTVLRRLYPMDGQWRYGLKAVVASGQSVASATTG